jgi:hypothetical protein
VELPASCCWLGRFAFEEREVVYLHLRSHSMQTAFAFCIVCWERVWCCTVPIRELFLLLHMLLDSGFRDSTRKKFWSQPKWANFGQFRPNFGQISKSL